MMTDSIAHRLARKLVVLALAGCGVAAELPAVPGPAPASALSLEQQEKETDLEHLRQIHAAIFAYRAKHGQLPDWLSDLVPEFLSDPAVLMSPRELRTGESQLWGYEDPKLKTSYIYEFSGNRAGNQVNQDRATPLTMKEWKTAQMEEFGPAIPVLRCHLYDPVLNVAYAGDIYETALYWETDPNTLALVERLGPGPGSPDARHLIVQTVRADTGEPVAGVQVIASDRQTEFWQLPPLSAETAANGECRVRLGKGAVRSVTLSFDRPGYAASPIRFTAENADSIPERLKVELSPAVNVGGTVRSAAGDPLPQVQVQLLGAEADAVGQIVEVPYDTVTTDPQGRWTSQRVPAAREALTLKLTHPEYLPGEFFTVETDAPGQDEVSIRALEAGEAVLVLEPGIDIAGVVRDPGGEPIAGAALTLQDTSEEPRTVRRETDADGRYRFVVMVPGPHRLVVQARDWAPTSRLVEAEPGLPPQDFVLDHGRSVRGRVLDETGQPLAGATLSVASWNGIVPLDWAAVTDADGAFDWKSAPEGNLSLVAAKPGYQSSGEQTPPQGAAELTLRLAKSFLLSGKVVDAETQQPIPAFKIARGIGWSLSEQDFVNWELDNQIPGANGQFSLEAAGRDYGESLKVMILADGYRPAASPLYPRSGWHEHTFELERGSGPKGRVTTPDGQPVAGAQVAMQGMGYLGLGRAQFRNVGGAAGFVTKTGSDGRFELAAFLPSPQLIAAHEKGYAEFSGDALETNAEVMLQPWGRLEGVLLRSDRQPWTGQEVMVSPASPGPNTLQYDWETFKATTDAQGRFQFEYVPPGARQLLRLVAMGTGDHRYWMHSDPQQIQVKAGENTRVTYGGHGRSVVGRFKLSDPDRKVDWNSGHHSFSTPFPQPPGDLKTPEDIRAWQSSAEFKEAQRNHRYYAMSIEADGTFRLENIPPGKYTLSIYLTDPGTGGGFGGPPIGNLSRQLEVPEAAAEEASVPFDLGEMTVQVR